MTLISPIVTLFDYAVQPVAPFTWFGLGFSTLDVVAAFRLCIVLRQIRDNLYRKHVKVHGHTSVEARSFVRSASTVLTVVFGGEAIACPYLLIPPSFMTSGVVITFYTVIQGIVDALPTIPEMSFQTELPLSIFDGFSRSYLLCTLIPPMVTASSSSSIASSPWTLLVTSLVTANGGFFLTNLFSFMNPTPLSLQTPPELQPYGWATADLWCAPLITGIYALLTHAQPFWADAHVFISSMLGAGVQEKTVDAVDPETARAVCAVLLACVFGGRTVKNFTGAFDKFFVDVQKKARKEPKTKTQ